MNVNVPQFIPAGLLLLIIMTAGCGANDISPPPPATLASISITPANPSLAPGTTLQFTATGNYSNGSKQVLTTSAT